MHKTLSKQRFLTALCLWLAGASEAALAASDWVVLDPDRPVYKVDRSSLMRNGPWVEFTQIWGNVDHGKPASDATVETKAVNCLTGAFGAVDWPTLDQATGRPVRKTRTLLAVEQAMPDSVRLAPFRSRSPGADSTYLMACTCAASSTVAVPPEAEIRRIYERDMAEQMQKVEYRLSFLRVDSQRLAREAIAKLKAGRKFEDVFDQYAGPFDAQHFKHGDLGAHLASEWPEEDIDRFQRMKVGEFSQSPHKGLFGWEVEKMVAKRVIPAPTLEEMHDRIETYLGWAQRCGWTP